MNKIFHPNIDELCVFSRSHLRSLRYRSPPLCVPSRSGSVCLDVINQTWSPMFGASYMRFFLDSPACPLTRSTDIGVAESLDMINIFEVFLPQLLRYPNPNDPLNGEAAALLMRHPKEYDAKVKEYVQRFATKEAADAAFDKDDEDGEDEEMSDIGSISDDDDAGEPMES